MRLFLAVLSLVLLLVPVYAQRVDTKSINTKFYYRLQSGTAHSNDHGFLTVLEGWSRPAIAQELQSPGQLWRIEDMGEHDSGVHQFRLTNGLQKGQSLDIDDKGGLVLKQSSQAWKQLWVPILYDGNRNDAFVLYNNGVQAMSLEATADQDVENRLRVTPHAVDQRSRMWVLLKTDIAVEEFELTSTSFVSGAKIPVKYTGEGADASPPLAWKRAPAGTKSFMIICTDPDAPSPKNPDPNPFVHWTILNIPGSTTNLPEGLPRMESLTTPAGAIQGPNGFNETGYGGPMPPKGSGRHRYFFTILAMDRVHVLDPNLTPQEFLKILDSSVLAKAELVGTYEVPAVSSVTVATPFRAVLDEILRLSNIERVNLGVPPLKMDSRLESAATAHSDEMARLAFFSHISPTPGRETPEQRILQAGAVARATAENIASFTGYPEATLAQEAVKGWMDSPGHRQNLLNPDYTHIGIGISLKGNQYYLTQKFCAY